jgi:hypothetical protein
MFTGNAFWTDLLGYCGSIGYVVSSALTLTVRSALPMTISRVRMLTAWLFSDLLSSASSSSIDVVDWEMAYPSNYWFESNQREYVD